MYFLVTDTKYYDGERSEESQKHSKKETEIEKKRHLHGMIGL